MQRENITRTHRHLPHWHLPGSTYFITFRLKEGVFDTAEQQIVFAHIRDGEPNFYRLYALVVMPDHVHLLVKPNAGIALARMMQGIKGITANKINRYRNRRGALWLGESYDRIIRDETEAIEKLNYICQNPARAEIVGRQEDYPFLYQSRLW